MDLLAGNVVARRSAARTLGSWLKERDAPAWARDYAVTLAEDVDEDVGNSILWIFRDQKFDHLVCDQAFIIAMARSAAAQRDPDDLIAACDRRGRLHPLAGTVLAIAHAATTGSIDPGDPWKRRHNAEQAAGLLIRLIQEAEQVDDQELIVHALDRLDSMIEKGAIGSTQAWKLVLGAAAG